MIGLFFFLVVLSLIELAVYRNNQIEVSIGITAGILSGIFILVFQQVIKEWESDDKQEITPPTNVASEEHNPDEASAHDEQLGVLKEVRDILKEGNHENRELTYTMLIFTWVVTVATLVVIGNDIWKSYGWSLPVMWIGTSILIFGGMGFLYCSFKKVNLNPYVVSAFIIGVIVVMLLLASSGITLPPSSEGNVTNVCENCSYPIINIVNNYNVTVTGGCNENTNPTVSVEELKYLINKHVSSVKPDFCRSTSFYPQGVQKLTRVASRESVIL